MSTTRDPQTLSGEITADEIAFQRWYLENARKLGLDINPDNPLHFYDWRAAYHAGASPDTSGHWPSEYKRLGHPNLVVDGVDTRTGQPIDPVTLGMSYLAAIQPKGPEQVQIDPRLLARPDVLSTLPGRNQIGALPPPQTYPLMDIVKDIPAALLQWTDLGGAVAAFNRGAAHQSEAIERARTRTDIDPTAQAIAALIGGIEPGPRDIRNLATVFVGYPAAMRALRHGTVREGGEAALKRLRLMEEGFNLDLPLYHGTSHHFTELEPKGWGDIWFSTDPKDAERYFSGAGEARARTPSPNIHPVYVKTENPFRGTLSEYNEIGGRELKKRGYDSAIIEFPDGRTHVAVFDKKNIMSQFDVFPDEKIVGNAIQLDDGLVVAGPSPYWEDIVDEAISTNRLTEDSAIKIGEGSFTSGYLTNNGRFVDSKEGMNIARKGNQIAWNNFDDYKVLSDYLNPDELSYPLPWGEFNQGRSAKQLAFDVLNDYEEAIFQANPGTELLDALSRATPDELTAFSDYMYGAIREGNIPESAYQAMRANMDRSFAELTRRAILEGDRSSLDLLQSAGIGVGEDMGGIVGDDLDALGKYLSVSLSDASFSAALADILRGIGR